MALESHQEAVPALCQAVRHHHPGKIQTRMGSVLHRQGSVTACLEYVSYLNNWLGEGPQWSFAVMVEMVSQFIHHHWVCLGNVLNPAN